MRRRLLVIGSGAVVGCLAGLLAPAIVVAVCVWDGYGNWSALVDPDAVPYLAALAALGALNGALGAWDGWRSNDRRAWPVARVPLLLLLCPAAAFVQYTSSYNTLGILLAVAIVAPFVWLAGRVGQEIGVAGRNSSPNPSPSPTAGA
jgi:hypothetical protein